MNRSRSQYVLQQSSIVKPIGLASSYHLYNHIRSKTLIQLNHGLEIGISYEKLQRQLTAKAKSLQRQIEKDGVYLLESMTKNSKLPYMFALDNLN